MINTSIDVGQIILICLIGIIGFFIKKTLDDITRRLDKQDVVIINLIKDVTSLITIAGLRQLSKNGFKDD